MLNGWVTIATDVSMVAGLASTLVPALPAKEDMILSAICCLFISMDASNKSAALMAFLQNIIIYWDLYPPMKFIIFGFKMGFL